MIVQICVEKAAATDETQQSVAFNLELINFKSIIVEYFFIISWDEKQDSMSSRNSTDFGGCESERKPEDCGVDDRPPTIAAILLLVLGSFLKGCGTVPCTTVGMAYMDDNVKKEKAPMYFGIISTSWMLGPLLGYLMSYSFLKYHEDPSTAPGFGPQDPLWIGRWWAGFVLQGVLLMVCAVPFALFPRWLPGRARATKVKEGEEIHLTGLWAALKRLIKNPIFMLLIIYDTFWFYGGYGHNMMLPKYMENQFRLSASEASILSGTPSNSALMVATAIGGYLISKFKPNAKYLTGSITVLQVIRAIGFFILMIPKCEILQMTNYGLDEQGLILEGPCNTNCSCTTNAFTSVCARDGKNETIFFSPCYAGCHGKINETFTNCSCLDSYGLEENHVTEGFCFDHGCWTQALVYTITLPIIVLIVNLLNVADQIIRLRCIETEDKSVALGTFEAVTSLFALFSMFLGGVVDSACLVWENSCGQTGNCWFYDITKFNYLMHGISALFTGLAAISMFSMFCLSKRMNDVYKEGEDI
ncbi:hypothetical protein JTE90_011960 [Oedothorax gibbosus]|uniref:Kazal-like domain-containing protein n=1 Tax=Oedothorax gibbosus TaxID=931172 RepID=A0AAV6V2X9_9ARAC|nr:hypothetical protein JTE90_011960 [Oedothorax gibbosus]